MNALTFTFDSNYQCLINVHQGCSEIIEQVNSLPKLSFVPLKNTQFMNIQSVSSKFEAGKNQKFPENLVQVNLNLYFNSGFDFTRSKHPFYPVIIHMVSLI